MKTDWPRKRINEIASHSLGKMLDKAKNKGEPRPYLRNLNVRWFGFDLSDLTEMRFLADEEARYTVAKGDLVICEGGYPGRAAIWNEDQPIHFQKALHRVRFHEPHHAKWCLYYLLAQDLGGTLKAHFNGAGIQHFTGEALAKFELPIAPPAEQQRIVVILDEAFEAIATAKANAEKNLQNARAIFDAQLQKICSADRTDSVMTTLGAAYDVRDGTHDSPNYHETGFPLVTSKNLKRDGLDFDDVKLISEVDYKKINMRSAVHRGDVLFAMIGTIGNPTVVEIEPKFAIKNMALFKVANGQSGHFLRYYLSSQTVIEKMRRDAKGTTQKFVGLGYLRGFPIALPPAAAQLNIVEELDRLLEQTDGLEKIVERKLAALDELKQSLLQQAFSGQLTKAKPVSISQQSALQTTTPEFAANVICFAYARHERQKREKTFGRVKEQKLLQFVESIGGIDLGRCPIKDAAGPNDFAHMLRAEAWAKAHNIFELVERGKGKDKGYDFRKLDAFDKGLSAALEALKPYQQKLESVIDLLVPMDSENAKVFATVHAAWNNLVIDGADVTDDAIVFEARENWHPDKLTIPEPKFREAIALIRRKDLVPDGTAKYVGGQTSLL